MLCINKRLYRADRPHRPHRRRRRGREYRHPQHHHLCARGPGLGRGRHRRADARSGLHHPPRRDRAHRRDWAHGSHRADRPNRGHGNRGYRRDRCDRSGGSHRRNGSRRTRRTDGGHGNRGYRRDRAHRTDRCIPFCTTVFRAACSPVITPPAQPPCSRPRICSYGSRKRN